MIVLELQDSWSGGTVFNRQLHRVDIKTGQIEKAVIGRGARDLFARASFQ